MYLDEETRKELLECIGLFQRGPVKKLSSISQGEMAMLSILRISESEMTPGELSDKLALSTARVANTLNSLEKRGYIERIHDLKDRRRVFVKITEAGRLAADKEEQEAAREMDMLLNALGEEDAREYVRIMRKVRNILLSAKTE